MGSGTATRSDRQTPRPGTMLVASVQLEATQEPDLSTWFAFVHARHELGPGPVHEEHDPSQALQLDEVVSRNSDREHVGRHRPDEGTGREDGHVLHWLNAPPEQVAQSE